METNKNGYVVIKNTDVDFCKSDGRIWFFFEQDGKRYFFKDENKVTNLDHEILAGYIAEHVGINAVKYLPAVFVDKDGNQICGVISEDYTNNGKILKVNSQSLQKYSDSKQNTIENQMLQLENFLLDAKTKFKGEILFDKRKIQNSLAKMMIFDTFLLNSDRARRNIEYLLRKVDRNTWEVDLAPIFDNSQIFGIEKLDSRMEIVDCIETKRPLPQSILKNAKFEFGTNECMDFDGLCEKISKYSSLNPYLKITVDKFKNLDLEKIYKQIKSEIPNFDISKQTFLIANKIVDGTVKQNQKLNKKRFCFEL